MIPSTQIITQHQNHIIGKIQLDKDPIICSLLNLQLRVANYL